FTMHEIAYVDGETKLSAIRNDSYTADDVLWADDDGGALVAAIASREEFPYIGQLTWLPSDGSDAVALPVEGRAPAWGVDDKATATTATVVPTPSPEQAALQILAATQWGVQPSSNPGQPTGIEGVHAFQLTDATGNLQPLWVAHTYGNRLLSPEQFHAVAIYSQDAQASDGWQEIAKLELTGEPGAQDIDPTPDYLAVGSVRQLEIEPSHIWIGVDGGVGAHGGTFQLVRFDGSELTTESAASAQAPAWAAWRT
ncbi:MAG: hypothetical protein HC802_12740, partial [Caldilineaceae bacterium]|nr:hypothetical protein [Caldilineaceae bacterium]